MLPTIIPLTITPDGTPCVDSVILAEHQHNEHASLMKLVRKNQPALERFGSLRFEIRVNKRADGRACPDTEVALLNEDQCFFILSLSRNTERVVELKGNMVAAFSKARKGPDLSILDPATQLLMQQVMEMGVIKKQQMEQESRLDKVEAILDSRAQYMTITAWGRVNNAPMSMKTAQVLGAACSAKCKKYDIRIGKVPCERWGEVNSYPIEVIDECSEKLR